MKKLFPVIIAFIMFFGCKKHNTLEMKFEPEVYNFIVEYINEHPKFNTFMLRYAPNQVTKDSLEITGYFIGPAYKDILSKNKLSVYLDINNKRVYCVGFGLNELLQIDESNISKWENSNPPDSIVYENSTIIKNSWPLYISHAVFFSILKNNKLVKNYRPDTIFSPRRSEIMFYPFIESE